MQRNKLMSTQHHQDFTHLWATDLIDAPDLVEAPDFELGTHSGRAVADERGNMIWEWQTAPGVYTREVTAQQLQNLSANELQLLDTPVSGALVQWSRKRVMPAAVSKPKPVLRTEHSAFDFFLKKLGLPA